MTKENPGKFPFKRGLYKNMYKERTWTMRQYAGFTTAEQTNQRFLKLLQDGVTDVKWKKNEQEREFLGEVHH